MSSDSEGVTVEINDRVAVIRFTPRPDGTISNRGASLLGEGVADCLASEEVRSLVLTGSQAGVFIRHANVEQIVRAAAALQAGKIAPQDFLETPFQQLCRTLDAARKPVIAAINGVCMGGGFEIALACTMRVAEAGVTAIGLPEIRIGIPPGCGGPQRLARLVGFHGARLFTLQGRVVDAMTAQGLGLVDAVAQDALAFSMEQARIFARRVPEAVAAIMEQAQVDDASSIRENASIFAQVLGSGAASASLLDWQTTCRPLDALE